MYDVFLAYLIGLIEHVHRKSEDYALTYLAMTLLTLQTLALPILYKGICLPLLILCKARMLIF